MPDGVFLNGGHEEIQLLIVQNIQGRLDCPGRVHLIGGVAGEESLFRRGFQGMVEGGVDVMDGSA